MASHIASTSSTSNSVKRSCRKSLQNFEGSLEEKALINILKSFSETDLRFYTLLIETCNVLKGVSFSHADVVFKSYVIDDLLKEATLPEVESVNFSIESLTFKLLFNFDLFDNICVNGLQSIPEKYTSVFSVLLKYLRDLRNHEKSISKVKKSYGKLNKSNVVAVMVQHFFSQLVPGHGYIVYNRSKNLPAHCPCGCNHAIVKGNTSIGSSFTWHGYADILINQSIPVSLLEESEPPSPGDNEVEDESKDYDNDISDEIEEPAKKKKKKEDLDVRVCIEVKRKSTSSCNILLQMHTVDQIVAETITNAFAQVNTNKSLSGMLIPTIGCTSDHLIVFMYDPVNDILLQSSELIPLWRGDKLNNKSLVLLWIILNFPFFGNSNMSDKFKLSKSEFHSAAKKKLEKYHDVRCSQCVSFHEIETYEAKHSYITDNHLSKIAAPKTEN